MGPGEHPPIVTGADLLAWMGTRNPTQIDSDWADLCCAALTDAIWMELDLPPTAEPNPAIEAWAEIQTIARLGAAEAYRRRDAPFGTTGYIEPNMGSLIRFARDYITGVWPILARYRSVRGLVA